MFQKNFTQNKSYWFWFSVTGFSLLLCIIILVLGNFAIYGRALDNGYRLSNDAEQNTNAQPDNPTITLINQSPVVTPIVKTTTADLSSATSVVLTSEPTSVSEPEFGPICFKAVTGDGQHLDCNTMFPATVVEVHAIFNYEHLRPQDSEWTRIWYHNGQEVLNVKEKWAGDTIGQFDYNLNTNDGKPLSFGSWELELYLDDQLQTYGTFVINTEDIVPEVQETPLPTPTSTPAPIASYQLAFTKWDGSKHAIWVTNLGGSEQHFLLDFAASPSWSPDGQRIIFFGEEGIDTQEAVSAGTNGVWVMDADGRNPTHLLPEGSAQVVNWSPVGDLIAFDAARGGPDRRVYFIDQAGFAQPFETLGQQPSFSPDGNQIVVKVCRPECGLWIVGRDDSNPRQLTTGGSDGLPAWSPDGSKIAFSRNVDDNVDIYIIDIDGNNVKRLTNTPGIDSVPTWTPDSQQIVFRTTRNGLWQIFYMNVKGLNQQLIVDNVGASEQWAFDRMSIK